VSGEAKNASTDDGSRPVTISHVARAADVSVGTVSNYLNRPDVVAEETRARIEAAIARLGWMPNVAVRALRRGRSALIGLVLSDLSNPFFTDVARGVEQAASEAGLTVILCNSDNSPKREEEHLATLGEYRAAGILITSVGAVPAEHYVELLRRLGSKLVLLARPGRRGGMKIPWVGVDDVHGGRVVGEHLLAIGHERVCFVHGPTRTNDHSPERLEGLRRAWEARGMPADSISSLEGQGLHLHDGVEVGRRLVSALPGPTAVFAANDLLAVGVLEALHEAGVRVPDDVALVGYDDLELAGVVSPPLTSVRQPRIEMGRSAVRLLLSALAEAPADHAEIIFTPQLVVRPSTVPRVSLGLDRAVGAGKHRASGDE
jgi:LacI family transcriptional regulator